VILKITNPEREKNIGVKAERMDALARKIDRQLKVKCITVLHRADGHSMLGSTKWSMLSYVGV
jgi:hypothetical protein